MAMTKPSRVVFINAELEENYHRLHDSDPIKKSITKAISALRQNAFSGIQIPKRLIPKEYQEYLLTNLWKYNLSRGWRLLYTITADDEVELITAILEWGDHKRYEQRMHY